MTFPSLSFLGLFKTLAALLLVTLCLSSSAVEYAQVSEDQVQAFARETVKKAVEKSGLSFSEHEPLGAISDRQAAASGQVEQEGDAEQPDEGSSPAKQQSDSDASAPSHRSD